MHISEMRAEDRINPFAKTRDAKGIPDHVVDDIARCLLPKIQSYFETEEGKAAFKVWKEQKNET